MRLLLILSLLLPTIVYAEQQTSKPDIDDVKAMYDSKRWSNTYLGLGGSGNNKLTKPTRSNMSFHHSSNWKYGYNEFNFTVVNLNQASYVIYGNYRPSLSLVKSSGVFTNEYPMLDFTLASQFSWNDLNERIFDIGFDIHLAPPNTWHYLIIGGYARKNLNHSGGTYSIQLRGKITIARSLMFKVLVDGTPKNQGPDLKANLLFNTELLLDIGRVWNRANQVYLGPTFQYCMNKFGRDGVKEYVYGANLIISL